MRGSINLARAVGLRPMVIGLTVVSFGTSSPELASTLAAALQGAPAVAFGNVVGSNIANLGLILGLSALLWPLSTTARFLRREVPLMLAASLLLLVLVPGGEISRFEGAVLLALLVLFLTFLLRAEPERKAVRAEFVREYGEHRAPLGRSLFFIVVGIALLILGAKALVTGAIGVARVHGISERVIGLTMVALGTSLPELASSIVAAVKKEGDIVLGNLIGSNVFNILCILGATAVAAPVEVVVTRATWVDLGVMLAVALLTWLFLATRLRLDRWEGAVLLASYCGYTLWLFL